MNVTLSNHGIIEAAQLAAITIGLNGDSTNFGTIDAFNGGTITLHENGHGFGNPGLIEALDGGGVSIVGGVTNFDGATIEAIGPNAFVDISNGTVDNQDGARIEASHRGSITFDSETVTNESGAEIDAKHLGKITFDVGSVTNDGRIEAKDYGSIKFEGAVFVKNNFDGTIEATKGGSITLDGGDGSDGASGENDGGTILAKDHGTVAFENIGFTNQDGGIIEAKDAGTIIIEGAPDGPAIFNDEGTIKAVGLGSTVQIIDNATVHGGSFDVEGGALFVDGNSNLTGSVAVSIGGGGFAGFGSAVNANGADVSVAFKGMGTLELDQPPAAPITVTGFGIGDVFDLTNLPLGNVTFSSSDDSLTIGESGAPALTLEGDYSESDFTLEPDAFGGTEVFFGDDVWTNTAGGDWTQSDGSNWNDGDCHAPNPTTDAVIGVSGVYTVTIVPVGNDESREVKAGSLAITDAGATLTGAGTLTVTTTLDNAGIIQPDGCLTIDVGRFDEAGTFINEYSGRAQSLDGNSLTINQESGDGSSINYGLFNAAGGNITLDREGSATNHGVLEATAGGTLTIHNQSAATNDGIIQSLGDGSHVVLHNNFADANASDGTMKAADGGSIAIYVTPSDGTGGGNFGKMEAEKYEVPNNQGPPMETTETLLYDRQLQLQSINGSDTLISNLGGGDSITLVGVNVADLQSSDFIFSNDPGGDPVVVPGTFNVVGDITVAANPDDTLSASFTAKGSDYVGTFTLDQPAKSNGAASLGFHFDLGNDQISLTPGQTLTQSYDISVTDAQNPAMNASRTVSVSVGGPGNDNFVFKPGVGLDTIVNFDPTHDTIELDHFANIQSVQQLASLIVSDVHGDAVIELGHNDSITVAGVTAAHLQQAAQSGHVIMH